MSVPSLASGKTVILVDTNVIIEAVRTNCWNALTGGRRVETVEECCDEATRGDSLRHGYVSVSTMDRQRLHKVHTVSDLELAMFALSYGGASGMDKGERDLFAHAFQRLAGGDDVWVLSSPDKASVRAAVHLDWGDRMHSLETMMGLVGTRPNPELDAGHTERWLSAYRTECMLGG